MTKKATEEQVGGTHYKECKNSTCSIYSRQQAWIPRGKHSKIYYPPPYQGEGALDILKVKHYADLILQLEYDMNTEEDSVLLSQEVHSTWTRDYI